MPLGDTEQRISAAPCAASLLLSCHSGLYGSIQPFLSKNQHQQQIRGSVMLSQPFLLSDPLQADFLRDAQISACKSFLPLQDQAIDGRDKYRISAFCQLAFLHSQLHKAHPLDHQGHWRGVCRQGSLIEHPLPLYQQGQLLQSILNLSTI